MSGPEFAATPAKISPAGREAQTPITAAGLRMLDGSCDMIRTAKALAINPRDPPTWQALASHSKTVSDAIKALVSGIRERAPGQAECDAAAQRLGILINRLDQASLSAMNQTLEAGRGGDEQHALEALTGVVGQINGRLPRLGDAAKWEAEHLGHAVRDVQGGLESLVDGSIAAAAHSHNSAHQQALLSQTKSVAEAALQVAYAAKDAGGNPKAVDFHGAVDESLEGLREALGDQLAWLQTRVSEAGLVSGMVESISRAIARTDVGEATSAGAAGDYVDSQTGMVALCKEMGRLGGEMVAKSYSEPGSLGPLALDLSRNYAELAELSRAATASVEGELSQRIRAAVQELGQAAILIVKAAGACRAAPTDEYARKELAEARTLMDEKIALVLAALQVSSFLALVVCRLKLGPLVRRGARGRRRASTRRARCRVSSGTWTRPSCSPPPAPSTRTSPPSSSETTGILLLPGRGKGGEEGGGLQGGYPEDGEGAGGGHEGAGVGRGVEPGAARRLRPERRPHHRPALRRRQERRRRPHLKVL